MELEIKGLLEQKLLSEGYILADVVLEKESSNTFLRIVIDKENGFININDCVLVNGIVNPILDEANLIDDSYILDVCSLEKGSD